MKKCIYCFLLIFAGCGGNGGGTTEFPETADQPVEWTSQFGNVGEDITFGLVVFDGFLYATGRAQIALSAPSGVPTFGQLASFLRKYDLDGNLMWSLDISILSATEAFAVAADDTGVYVAGRTEGINPPGGFPFGFVNKYDFGGNELWSLGLSAGLNGSPRLPWAVEVADGAVFLAGGLRGIFEKPFVARLTPDGMVVWITEIVESTDTAFALAIRDGRLYALADDIFVVDTMGNFIGRFNAQFRPRRAIGTSSDGVFVTGLNPSDGIWKFDFFGNELWHRSTISGGNALVVAQNYVLFCGFDVLNDTTILEEFSFAGEPRSSRLFEPNIHPRCSTIDVLERSIFLGGWTAGAFDGFQNNGDLDAFVARLLRPDTGP